MEHWEILAPGGYRFVYDDALFRPSTDTFLLASLPRLKPGLRVCDLGCGTGLLSLLLLQRQPALFVTGIDRLPAATELARKAAEINGLAERLTICAGDLREAEDSPPAVLCVPPGPRPPALCRSSAKRQLELCDGEAASAWSTSRNV